jgi:hypothetical protein
MKSIFVNSILIASVGFLLLVGTAPLTFASTATPSVTKVPVTLKATPKSETVAPGQTATYKITYHNAGSAPYTFTGCVFTVNGAKQSCTLSSPIVVAGGGKGTYTFTVTTSTAASPGTDKCALDFTSATDRSGTARFTLVIS